MLITCLKYTHYSWDTLYSVAAFTNSTLSAVRSYIYFRFTGSTHEPAFAVHVIFTINLCDAKMLSHVCLSYMRHAYKCYNDSWPQARPQA